MMTDKPLAARGLISYRAYGRYGWIMIGARSLAEAWSEAIRSSDTATDLQIWSETQGRYVPAVMDRPPE